MKRSTEKPHDFSYRLSFKRRIIFDIESQGDNLLVANRVSCHRKGGENVTTKTPLTERMVKSQTLQTWN